MHHSLKNTLKWGLFLPLVIIWLAASVASTRTSVRFTNDSTLPRLDNRGACDGCHKK